MDFVTFQNGIRMPIIGLGTWAATFSASPEDEAIVENAVRTAITDVGYLHLDTAYVYGIEKAIGRALKKLFDAQVVRREDIFVTTKLPPIGNTPEKVAHFLKLSLENLQLDYIDLYLIHAPVGITYLDDQTLLPITKEGAVDLDLKTDLVALWKAMENEVDSGRTKSIGVSNFLESQIERILQQGRIPPANLQVELSVYLQQKQLRNFCNKNGITICAYSPLGSPGGVQTLTALGVENKNINILKDAIVEKIASKHSKTCAQIALKFFTQQGVVVIPKSFSPQRIRENFQIFDFELDSEDIAALEALDRGESGRVFRMRSMFNYSSHPECSN